MLWEAAGERCETRMRSVALVGVGLLAVVTPEPLLVAARSADVQRVVHLLAEGADPNGRSPDGWTPLMAAASHGHESVITALINAGADVNAQDENGRTALLEAVYSRQIPVVSLLLKAGADPNIRAHGGESLLSMSRWRVREFRIGSRFILWRTKVRDDDELVRLLVEAGAKP